MKSLRTLLAASAICSVPLSAQTGVMTFETGYRSDAHRNGITHSAPFGGIGAAVTMQGSADKNTAALLIGSFEIRMGPNVITDFNGFADFAFRAGNLTAGAGLAAQYDSNEEMTVPVPGGKNVSVWLNYPISLGYSGFGKLNFGPSGKTFVQGRYSIMPATMTRPYGSASTSVAHPDVPMMDSHMLRVACGQTFDKWIFRVQLIQETWRFERKYDNANGAWDRDSRIGSVGLTRIF